MLAQQTESTMRDKVKLACDKIIVALDVKTVAEALGIVRELKPRVGGFMIGFEFITATYVDLVMHRLVEVAHQEHAALHELFSKISGMTYVSSNLMGIPSKVASASRSMTNMGIRAFDVHCTGGEAMMRAAVEAAESHEMVSPSGRRPLVLGQTVLTSLDYLELIKLGLAPMVDRCMSPEVQSNLLCDVVVKQALLAKECGLDGVIAPPHAVKLIREQCGSSFVIYAASIRPDWAPHDDQKQTMTPAQAIQEGATSLIIGRPLTRPPKEVGSRSDAAMLVTDEIVGVL